MSDFPIDKLRPLDASLAGDPGDAELQIPLEPFQLGELDVDTAIQLDGIALPTIDLPALQQRTFDFPVNPQDGYIDGSVYIEHAHHPVDVTRISFGDFRDGKLLADVTLTICFSVEGLDEFDDVQSTIAIRIEAA